MPVLDEAVADIVEDSGEEAWVEVPFGEVQFPTILRAFDAVRAAASADGRTAVGPPREIYVNGEPYRCEVSQPFVAD